MPFEQDSGIATGPSVPARIVYVEPLASGVPHLRTLGLAEIWELICERKITVMMVLILALAAASIFTFLQRPMFRATTTIEIQGPRENTGLVAAVTDNQAESFMRTQIRVLQGKTLRGRVTKDLASADRKWPIRPSVIEKWVQTTGLIRNPDPAASGLPPVRLGVRNLDGTSLVELTAESTNPQFAAEYVNTVARQFGSLQTESRLELARETGKWISLQIEDTRNKLRKAESELQSFSQSNGRVYGPDQQSADQARLTQLESELSKAGADRFQRQSNFEISMQSAVETIPQVAENLRISEYNAKLVDLKRESAELRSQMTPEHYKVQRVEAQIRTLESIIQKEREDVRSRIRNEYTGALRREQLLRDAYGMQKKIVNDQAGKAVYSDLLKREVESERKLYEDLLEKSKGANLAAGMTGGTVRVIDAAEVPMSPYSPTPIRNLEIAILIGLVGGVFFIVVSDHINRRLNAPGETPYHLKVPELGIIPAHESDSESRPRRRLNILSLRTSLTDGEPNGRDLVPVWKSRTSMVAESIRSTVASILTSVHGNSPLQVILITSPSQGDGKTATVASLGVALAEIDQRVLLIDADMRKPHLHHLFNVPNSWGLSNLLREKTSLQDMPVEAIAQPTDIPGLSVLSSGPGTATIAHLLYSQRLNALVERIRNDFDVILIDTPPMSFISDARVLGRVADAVVLVIRAGHTTRDEARSAKERLQADKMHLLGTILNGWDPNSRVRYVYSDHPDSLSRA